MALPNGRAGMSDSLTPSTLSPKSFSPTNGLPQSMTSSTLDDASLDELDRIMDTLSTLSREASLARGPGDGKRYTLPSPLSLDRQGQRSLPVGYDTTVPLSTTTPRSSASPVRNYPIPASIPIPPPTTSPPQTPVVHSPRNFTPHPKVMTLASLPSHHQPQSIRSDARNPATIPRLPSNPYENTSILHGSHMMRPSSLSANGNPNPFPTVPDSPYVNKNPNTNNDQYFFGPLPVSPQPSVDRYPPTGPKPPSMIQNEISPPQKPPLFPNHNNNRFDVGNVRSPSQTTDKSAHRYPGMHRPQDNCESQTLPAYNEKRSYLKNLEKGTLPRPRVEATIPVTPKAGTPNLGRKLTKPKSAVAEGAGEALNRLSLRRPSKNNQPKRTQGRIGMYNVSKTPSRHSTTSFNSFDMGRGYASVSTAPASTHGLIQHEVLPHRRKQRDPSPLANTDSQNSSVESEDENCCVRCGRFLYSHMLELFILVAFSAGLPAGIVCQATEFSSSPWFQRYFTFWGSTMLPLVLSTITPLIIISSMLTGMGNLAPDIFQRVTLVSILYYVISTFSAVCIGAAFSFLMNPGYSAVLNDSVSTNSSGDSLSFVMDTSGAFGAVYNTTSAANSTVADEVFFLFTMFFPGCGTPSNPDMGGICNVFVLALFAGVIGIGASIMGLEGGPIRHVLSQVGTVMSNMADILLWYVPVGVFFYFSELSATKIDWTNMGQNRETNPNFTSPRGDGLALNDATKWFIVTVTASLATYCLILMPLIASIGTLSNPFSLLGFRSVAPLLTSITIGFSDICIPLTVRSLIKGKGISRCCKPHDKVDRRIARVSAVLGGIFHRAGSAILITCSAIFLLKIHGLEASFSSVVVISLSAMLTSVTSLGGRWFFGENPILRASVICISTSGTQAPPEIAVNLLCLWLLCRFAAFADTIIDIFGAQITHKACKSKLSNGVAEKDDSKDERSTNSSNTNDKNRESVASDNKLVPHSGETSDYEDAPLLFSRSMETGNESNSMNSRNDDSVFLPNRPQEAQPNPQTNPGFSGIQRPQIHSVATVGNPGINSKEEVAFVTF